MKHSPNTGIKPSVLHEICFLAQKHHLEKVLLFGPRAEGTFSAKSSIQLAVSGRHTAAFSLDVRKTAPTFLKIEITVLENPLSKELLQEIKKTGILLYEKKSRFDAV